MPFNLRLAILLIAFVLALLVIFILKKDLIPVKFSLLWWLAIILLVFLSIFPDFVMYFVRLLGFQTTSNMVTGILIVILIFITISLTIIVSNQNKKISLLIQEISIIKSKLDE